MARRAPDHPFGFGAHGQDGAGKGVDRDDGRLVQDHPATANVDERVRGPEVDRHIATKEPENPLRPLGTGRGGRRMLNPFGHGFLRGAHSTGPGQSLATGGRGNHRGAIGRAAGRAGAVAAIGAARASTQPRSRRVVRRATRSPPRPRRQARDPQPSPPASSGARPAALPPFRQARDPPALPTRFARRDPQPSHYAARYVVRRLVPWAGIAVPWDG